MSTIGDRVPIVTALLGGRTDLAASISEWIANGYRDLASTVPFETLEDTEDSLCVADIGEYDYPATARAIKALTILSPSTTPASAQPLYKRNMAILDRYSTANTGTPAIWAPFKASFHVRPVPNDAYPLIIRFWQKVVIDTDDTDDTEILVPDDWLEIVDYEAQMRGYMNLQEFDKAAAVRSLLYGTGDPRKPGIIKQRLTRIQAEYENANYGMRPRKHRYSNVR